MFKKTGSVFICAVMMVVLFSPSARAEAQSAVTERQEHEKAAEKKLNDLDKNMDELVAESAKKEGPTQAEMNRLYEEFKKQQGVAGKDLEELKKSTNETWEKAKREMDKAIANLNGLYERSKAKSKGQDKGEKPGKTK